MRKLFVAPKPLRWARYLVLVILCVAVSASGLRAQFLKKVLGRDKPAATPQSTDDGGFNNKRAYDNFTLSPLYPRPHPQFENLPRLPKYDRAKLLATVSRWEEKHFPAVTSPAPTIPGAEMVNDDTLCATCHEAYVRYHRTNIHRNQSCEACHGPASEHLRTRGTKPGLILSPKTLKPAEASEICLRCHEKYAREAFPGQKWRTSTHAHAGNSCTDCHRNHYNVPVGTPATQLAPGGPKEPLPPPKAPGKETEAELKAIRAAYQALGATDPQTCNRCHLDKPGAPQAAKKICDMMKPGHPHQVDGPNKLKCTSCHDPHGVLTRAMRTDRCIECHKTPKTMPWCASSHAKAGMACVECHNPHSDAPALGAANAQVCNRCHTEKAELEKPGHPHQVNGSHGFKCVTCHNPHDNLSNKNRLDQCMSCHNTPKTMPWCASTHAKAGVLCTDCHDPHGTYPALGAAEPKVCYQCHKEKAELERVAHPHQILGPNGHRCVTCHNPHDNVRRETRVNVCLTCHKGHPTMAWKSSTHALQNVACVDCHNPHPCTDVPQIVDITHTQVNRPKRMPMSVEEPRVCFRCHQKIFAQFSLPFHHPLKEGKMVCSECHDAHGQQHGEKLLKEPTVNLVCFRCHTEKQGPFVWEHAPVTENCAICHNPHGTVTKQLLKQPVTFLCLRCHAGHRGFRQNIDSTPGLRPGFYRDCTQCHSQIHGSDFPTATRFGPRMMR